MAIKATIHKAAVQVSDLDRNIYEDHQLTIARHPSETDERMMVRMLAFALNAPQNNDLGSLEFSKDMWEPDEPSLWQKDHTGLIEHWIELGQPDEKRIMKACGRSKRVTIYCFSSSTPAWWSSVSDKLSRAQNLTVWYFPAEQAEQLATLAERSMVIQLTVQDGTLFISEGTRSVEITPECLQSPRGN
jgi:uncharacterized protein YaeQ